MKKIFILLVLLSVSAFGQWRSEGENVGVDWGLGNAMDVCNETTAVISLNYDVLPRSIFLTTDAGATWQEIETPDLFSPIDVALTDADHIWYTYEGKIYATTDRGANWTLQFDDPDLTLFVNYIRFFDSQNGIAMADGLVMNESPAVFLKTTDGGENWISMNDSAFGSYSRNAWYVVDFVDMENGFFFANTSTQGEIWKTHDSGQNWEETSLKINGVQNFIDVINFYDTEIGYCAHLNSFRKTNDGGENWEEINMGNEVTAVMHIEITPGNPDRVWAGDVSGLYLSDDGGNTWGAVDIPDFDNLIVRKIQFFDADHGFLLGDNGKIYYIDNASTITSVEDETANIETYSLSQNYPNPFNPSTTIEYRLPENGFVTLKIYDILGSEVAELVNQEKSSGIYHITFDAGSELASGIYFYRISVRSEKSQIENFIQTKKMILLK